MVQPDVEMLLAVSRRRGGDIVLIRRRPVGMRIQGGDSEPDRVAAILGNHIAREGKLRERIDRQEIAAGKIADALEIGGHIGDPGKALPQAAAFVVAEEERPVLYDRTAQRRSELVALVLWALLCGWSEEVPGVQRAVPKEFVGGAVELVGAGLERDAHLSAGVSAERGVVSAGNDLELAHGVHRRGHGDAVQLGVAIENAVQEKVIGILARAVDVDGEVAANRSRGALGRRSNAGKQEAEFEEVAPIEREACDLEVLDQAAQRGGVRAQNFGGGGHFHGVRALAREQWDLNLDFLVQSQRELSDLFAIALMLGLDPVVARGKAGDRKSAQRVGGGASKPVRLSVDDLNHRAGERRLRGVGDRATDRLGGRSHRKQHSYQECSPPRQKAPSAGTLRTWYQFLKGYLPRMS